MSASTCFVGRKRGECAEVGVGVDGHDPQPQPVGEQVPEHEGARGLADAALRRDHSGDVGAADRRLLAQHPLELGLLALGLRYQQPIPATHPAPRDATGAAAVHHTTAVKVSAAQSGRPAHPSLSSVPTWSRLGSLVPMPSSLSHQSRATSRAILPFEALVPSSRRAIDQSESPGSTT
jgi:hypothetical protein